MDDLIRRQDAIDAAMHDVSDKRTHEFNAGATRAANRIKSLPSAQPEHQWIPLDVLDKIRAEIEQLPITDTAIRLVGDVIDKYKSAESEE